MIIRGGTSAGKHHLDCALTLTMLPTSDPGCVTAAIGIVASYGLAVPVPMSAPLELKHRSSDADLTNPLPKAVAAAKGAMPHGIRKLLAGADAYRQRGLASCRAALEGVKVCSSGPVAHRLGQSPE